MGWGGRVNENQKRLQSVIVWGLRSKKKLFWMRFEKCFASVIDFRLVSPSFLINKKFFGGVRSTKIKTRCDLSSSVVCNKKKIVRMRFEMFLASVISFRMV